MMSPKGKITVVIADDTFIAREGWKRILETSEEIKIIGEAKYASEAPRIVVELKPQVVLMDLRWFGDDTAGSAAIREIKHLSPSVKVIAITAYENLIRDARLAGADSALSKTFTRADILAEIHEQVVRPNSELVLLTLNDISKKLTQRELEVLNLLGDGHPDKEMAHMLGLSPTTVKNHVKNILEKLGARNRTQAVSVAREMGLIK